MKRCLVTVAALALASLATAMNTAAQESAETGAGMYRQYCASCHGVDGKGGGPAASALKVKPPDLTRLQQKGEEFPTLAVLTTIDGTRAIAAHGSSGMPIWGRAFRFTKGTPPPENVIYTLINYLKTIQQNR